MAEKRKSDIRFEFDGIVEEIVAEERNSVNKKKKKKKKILEDKENSKKRRAYSEAEDDAKILKKINKEMKADFDAYDDGGKKLKKRRVDSEGEDDAKILKKKNKEIRADSEGDGHGGKKLKKKSVDSEGTDGVKKSKKKRKKSKVDSEADDDGGKKSKKSADSEASDDGGKKSKKGADSEAKEGVKKTKKKRSEIRVDSEAGDDGKKKKNKKEFGGDQKDGRLLMNTDDVNKKKTRKRKRDDSDLGAEENIEKSSKEMTRKSKKKKKNPNVDSKVEEKSLNSAKDAKKKRKKEKPSKGPTKVEENNKESSKGIANSEVEENDLNSKKDAKKKHKKKKKKTSEDSEAEENNNGDTKDAKTKQDCSKSTKRVTFSDKVEYLPTESEEESEEEEVELVRGKRFTKEEDNLVKKAVLEYIENHALGEEGIKMVMSCQSHKLKGCWKEITSALPWRPSYSVYHRAHTLFEERSKGIWTKEDFELVKQYQSKHGNQWKTLAEAMGKHRIHVKDTWRRIRLNKSKGNWSKDEYQTLFDLVNTDLRSKGLKEKHSKHGMLRDNIPWMSISDELGTRDHATCCNKWYEQLVSPMVVKGIWDNVDDYRLLDELVKLDAACFDDVDWDEILDNRDGETCRKRWKEMVRHIGSPGSKTFAEQVEILSERYCPDLAEDREDFDNRPFDPEN